MHSHCFRHAAIGAIVIACALGRVAQAQPAPQLLADINKVATEVSASEMTTPVVSGGQAFFSAWSPEHGRELWVTDGTAAGTYLVVDLNAGPDDALDGIAGDMAAVPGGIVFAAWDGLGDGRELWFSDGTAEGTHLVLDLHPGTEANPGDMLSMDGFVLFRAEEPATGRELWRTDGTAFGTSRVLDLAPGASHAHPDGLVRDGHLAFFAASSTGNQTRHIYRTDGTEANTVLFSGPFTPGWAHPQALTPADGQLFFTLAFGGSTQREPWRSDGSAPGTYLLLEIRAGSIGSQPTGLTALGSSVLFAANESSAQVEQLWISDGTSLGTRKLLPGGEPVRARSLARLGSQVLFAGRDATTGFEPWTTDGTDLGTSRLSDIVAGSGSSNPIEFTIVGGAAVFAAGQSFVDRELWITDGTPGGTQFLSDVRFPGESDPMRLAALGNLLIFEAAASLEGREPHACDTTTGEVELLADINQTVGTVSSYASNFTQALGRVFFIAEEGTVEPDQDYSGVYVTDGTPEGTQRLCDFPGSEKGGAVFGGVELNGLFIFPAGSQSTGREMWASDGTPEGTFPLVDACPGACDAILDLPIVFNGHAYFAVEQHDGSMRTLWRTDGTPEGTEPVTGPVVSPGAHESVVPFAVAQGGRGTAALIFRGFDPASGVEPWTFDGTTAAILADLNPGPDDSYPYDLTSFGSMVVFTAYDPAIGHELFVTDGTPGGTHGLDLVPGETGSLPTGLAAGESRVYFVAETAAAGREPWTSDGTLGGSAMLADLSPGTSDSMYEGEFCIVGERAFFSAHRPAEGYELWTSDGTELGTVLLADIDPGSSDSYPSSFTPWRGRVYFIAREAGNFFSSLWVTDGTSERTRAVPGIPPTLTIDYPRDLAILHSTLIFAPQDPAIGYEPWALSLCQADYDLDGLTKVPDIFIFLTRWFDQSPAADFDGNGLTEVPDIFAFLTAWFAGCP